MQSASTRRYGLLALAVFLGLPFLAPRVSAQIEPNAGNWHTWVLSSGSQLRLQPPPGQRDSKEEIEKLLNLVAQRDSSGLDLIKFWEAGSPSYRWNQIAGAEISKFNLNTPRGERVLALVHVAIY